MHFDIEYDVTRHERIALNPAAKLSRVALGSKERSQDLQPDALVPITGVPAELAVKVTAGKNDPLDKAHAIYDYVFTTMKYDKSGTGWGHGDVLYACDAKKGNCTDFHSLFIAMARSQGIPARFEIGFPLPPDKHSGEIAGYHCWSDFYIDGKGWIPVDISEAWKHPEKRDYFFGSHDVNRVQFTMGRDLTLSPAQNGKPLNYFVYPYVEVDGQEYGNVSSAFSFARCLADRRSKITRRWFRGLHLLTSRLGVAAGAQTAGACRRQQIPRTSCSRSCASADGQE